MHRRTLFLILTVATIQLASHASARADGLPEDVTVACHGVDAANEAIISRDNFGTKNGSATADASVFCQLKGPSANSSQLSVVVYARNSAQLLSCTLYDIGLDGSINSAVERHVSGSLGSGPQTLSFGAISGASRNFVLGCSIPRTSSGQFSHIANYHFGTTSRDTLQDSTAGSCQGANNGDIQRLYRDQFGIHNTSTVDNLNITCPIDNPGTAGISLYVYARNSTVPVTCTVTTFDAFGNITGTQSQSVPGAPGSSFTKVHLGVGSSKNVSFSCTIPPVQAGAFSHVTAYAWDLLL